MQYHPFRVLLVLILSVIFTPLTSAQDWQLVWSDEFDGTAVDSTKWSFQIGDGCPELCGWGNNELQYYRAENASVSDGVLTITAQEEAFMGKEYTSARMRTIGKGDFTYGRIEARAKMPEGQGMWPAFWMLPTEQLYGGWAASGEIDVVEVLGHEPEKAIGTIHYGGPAPANVFTGADYILEGATFADDFHVFAVEWHPGIIRWYVDDILYATQTDWFSTAGEFPAPFNQDFHLLLNLAVGGNFPGNPDETTVLPQTYEIDYVRVFETDNTPPTISISNPRDGAILLPGSPVRIRTESSDTDGSVFRTRFFQGDALLGEAEEEPFEFTVGRVVAGCYTISAEAVDNLGGVASSEPASIRLGPSCVQAPYLMQPAPIPGMIEAENYDMGGQDEAYNDVDPETNNGNVVGNEYRQSEGVDIAPTNDAGLGHHVGWLEAGEWLEYLVDVEQGGEYNIDVRVAAEAAGGIMHLELNGQDLTGPIEIGPTGGDDVWATVRTSGVVLSPGDRTIRVVIDQGGFNLNNITFVRQQIISTEPALFDSFEDGDASDWFGAIDVISEGSPVGNFAIATTWTGGGNGFYGGIFRNLDQDEQPIIPVDPWVNLFVYHDSEGTTVERYRLEITVREDTDGNGWVNGQEDSRRLDVWFDAASFNDQWVLVSAPVDSMLDLNTGTNGFLEGKVDEVFIGIAQVEGPNPSDVKVNFDHIILTSGGPFDATSTSIDDGGNDELPDGPRLGSVYPNPFQTLATVDYELSQASHIELDVFDMLGRKVVKLVDTVQHQGRHVAVMDGSRLAAGTYFVSLRIDGRLEEARAVLKY